MKRQSIIILALSLALIVFISGCASRLQNKTPARLPPAYQQGSQAPQGSTPQSVDAVVDAQLDQAILQNRDDLNLLEQSLL